MRRPTALGDRRRAVDAGQLRHRSVKRELRDNLIEKIRAGKRLFPGIIGYDESVIPQIINAILSQHNFVILGLRGQAKRNSCSSASTPELNISRPGNFKAPMGFSRERVHVLLSLDTEQTNLDGASPRARVRKGGDYPQSWWRYWGEGRVFYTSLGHLAETWTNDSAFKAHLTGGIRWALGLEN